MEHDTISLDTYLGILWRSKWIIIFCMVASLGTSAVIYLYTPKLFKATSEISVQSGFFKNPLVSDVIPEIHDVSELQALRESFLKKTLSDDFIDEIAIRFGIYNSPPHTRERGRDRQLFRMRIESGRESAGYYISIVNEDPKLAYKILKTVVERLVDLLRQFHTNRLKKAANVIESRVETLSKVLSQSGDEDLKKKISNRLTEVQAQLSVLTEKFTENHPAVTILREKEKQLLATMEKLVPREPIVVPKGMTIDTVHPAGPTNQAIYGELVEKLSKLKILLDMEKTDDLPPDVSLVRVPKIPESPFKPQKERYLGVGFMLGLLISAVGTLVNERRLIAQESMDDVMIEDILQAPCLGTLVVLRAPSSPEYKPTQQLPYS
jgi:uncharacterized protein involved in exopolysaccharide biosynthesis